jgi:VCBS repeat-containing protein
MQADGKIVVAGGSALARYLDDNTPPAVDPGVLSNDTEVDGPQLTVNLNPLSGPANGTLRLNANGGFSYRPNQNFTGTDSFVYEVTDGFLTDTATVTINVTPVNDAPVAVADNYSVAENGKLTIATPGVLSNDTDVDGPTLIVNLLPESGPAHGTLSLTANGGFTYTPSPSFSGPDSFVYEMTDGFFTDTQTVWINVTPANNSPPAARIIGPSSGVRGQTLSFEISATDSPRDVAAGFIYRIQWGDGSAETVISAPGNSDVTLDHMFTKRAAITSPLQRQINLASPVSQRLGR